jgi:hypothetical protein
MAQLLKSAGFEVIAATDPHGQGRLRQGFRARPQHGRHDLLRGTRRAACGREPSCPGGCEDFHSLRSRQQLGPPGRRDWNAGIHSSRMRIVVLDACRNNPFPDLNDAVRGLAIVDAPNGSIVGYSTAPGSEAQDGDGGHSPYTQAFLHLAREPNLPIEQLFKRVRLEVNNSTDGEQTPWESSSLTRAPDRSPIIQTASNLPSRSVRQAYDYVLSEGSPEHYQEFIELFPHVRSHPRAAQKPGAGASVAQGGACELARCLQELLRQLRQQPVCSSCVEIAVAAEERAGDAVHPSHEAAAARPDVQADEYRFVEGQSRHQAG